MPDAKPTPGLPNPADAFRAVAMVRAASRSTEGVVSAISLLAAMPRDPRYRISGWCRLGVPALLAAAVLNFLIWNYLLIIPVFATIMERVLLVGIGMGGYVLLKHELDRYRNVLDYIAVYGSPVVLRRPNPPMP
jgi:hypothetical protein